MSITLSLCSCVAQLLSERRTFAKDGSIEVNDVYSSDEEDRDADCVSGLLSISVHKSDRDKTYIEW